MNADQSARGPRVDVLIDDPAALDDAARFYGRALDRVGELRPAEGGYELTLGGLTLLIRCEPSREDRFYRRSVVPRVELRVDDVDATLRDWVAAGGEVKCRLTAGRPSAPDEPATYAQVQDPYGHLWSFLLESSLGHRAR